VGSASAEPFTWGRVRSPIWRTAEFAVQIWAGLRDLRGVGCGTLMITSLKLENFRLFTGLEIAPLQRINLFAGANNTGKTGILEALYLLFGEQLTQLPSAFRSTISAFPPQPNSDDFATFWQALIYDRQTEVPAFIHAGRDSRTSLICGLESGLQGPLRLFYHVGDIKDQHDPSANLATRFGVTPAFVIDSNGNISPGHNSLSKKFIVLSTRLEHPTRDADLYNQVTLLEGGEEKLLQLLREIDPRLQKLRYLKAPGTNQPLVYAYFGLKNALSVTQTGQGFSKLFSLFCQMLVSKAEVLLIDEIENGLYYETMPQIWKGIATLAASENIQVFATTHSRECLIAAHETMKAQPRYDFALHRLQRVNGHLEAVTHDMGMLEVALKSGLEVR
jgi:hypothetical protein